MVGSDKLTLDANGSVADHSTYFEDPEGVGVLKPDPGRAPALAYAS
jgi:hypothetical protein